MNYIGLLNNFIKCIDIDYNVYEGCFNEADIEAGDTVYISYKEIDRTGDYTQKFNDFICSMWEDAGKFSDYIWAFLHEVGHLETYSTVDDDELFGEYLMRMTSDDDAYMRLPSERTATEWAVDFAYHNQTDVMILDNKLKYLICEAKENDQN